MHITSAKDLAVNEISYSVGVKTQCACKQNIQYIRYNKLCEENSMGKRIESTEWEAEI